MTRKTNTYKGKKYIYYYCPTGKKHGCTHPVMLREDELADCVLKSLQAHINNIVSLDELLDSISEEQINRELITGYKAQIAENMAQLEQVTRFKTSLYQYFVSGIVDKDDYRSQRNYYADETERLQGAIARLKQEMESARANASDRLKWTQHFKRFSTMTELDRRAVVALIQCIQVVEKTNLNITFRYQVEYDAAMERLERCRKEAV